MVAAFWFNGGLLLYEGSQGISQPECMVDRRRQGFCTPTMHAMRSIEYLTGYINTTDKEGKGLNLLSVITLMERIPADIVSLVLTVN